MLVKIKRLQEIKTKDAQVQKLQDTKPLHNSRLASLLLRRFGKTFAVGKLDIVLPDGQVFSLKGEKPGPSARLVIHRYRFFRRLLYGGDIGFAEAYMAGDVSSDNMLALLEIAIGNLDTWEQQLTGSFFSRLGVRLGHVLRHNSRHGARKNVAHHYDLSNDFYAAWLDPDMTYSGGLFYKKSDSLEQAQMQKYARLRDMLDLEPGQTLLEIGCGWGGLAQYIAKKDPVIVHATTISARQLDYAKKRILSKKLQNQVTVAFEDYRDTKGVFDRIVSVEMIEAIGAKYWPQFFRTLNTRLKDDGKAVLQSIVIGKDFFEFYRKHPDFIQTYIFPGGMLPTADQIRTYSETFGFVIEESYMQGSDYAITLAKWRENFHAARDVITDMGFDERFYKMWDYYLAYCEAGFRAKRIDVLQIGLRKKPGPLQA